MVLSRVFVSQFRNLVEQWIRLHPRLNVLVGRNAQGKTNFIEAIYSLSHGRSFRTSDFRDVIRRGASTCEVIAHVSSSDGDTAVLKLEVGAEGKRMYRDNKRLSRLGIGGLFAVLFSPEEFCLFKGAPIKRRGYIDSVISKLDSTYSTLVSRYRRVLLQRNGVLADKRQAEDGLGLSVWDEGLVKLGAAICWRRILAVDELNAEMEEIHSYLTGGKETARLSYVSSLGDVSSCAGVEDVCALFEKELGLIRREEMLRGRTMLGPHKDDVVCMVNNADLRRFGSQGQHRTAVISLKLAAARLYLRRGGGRTPVFLMDDVAGEIDTFRKGKVFEYIDGFGGQVLVTATATEPLDFLSSKEGGCFCVEGGVIAERDPRQLWYGN